MVGVFSRSWQITKLTFSVIKKDKKLLLIPILSSIFSVIFVLALIFPTIFLYGFAGGEFETDIITYSILFVIYFGLAFISTFFNVSAVYIIKGRFEKKPVSILGAFKFSFSKIHLIFLWSLISAIVGILLRLLEALAKRIGGAGGLVINMIKGLLGFAWSIATIFVIPILVYKGINPFKAIGESTRVIKKTWGENLVQYFGFAIMQIIFIVIGIGLTILSLVLFGAYGMGVILTILTLAVIYITLVILIFSVANTIYDTALFVYADTGNIPSDFNKEVITHAFEKENT